MPKDLKQRTMERLERTQDAINNWDPIEAIKEDYNRLKGKMGPADAVELIQPIAPLDGQPGHSRPSCRSSSIQPDGIAQAVIPLPGVARSSEPNRSRPQSTPAEAP